MGFNFPLQPGLEQPFQVIARQVFHIQVRHGSLPALAGPLISFHTFKDPPQFQSSAIDSRFYGSLGNTQDLGNLLVVEVLQVAQDHGFPQVGGELVQPQLQKLPALPRFHLAA